MADFGDREAREQDLYPFDFDRPEPEEPISVKKHVLRIIISGAALALAMVLACTIGEVVCVSTARPGDISFKQPRIGSIEHCWARREWLPLGLVCAHQQYIQSDYEDTWRGVPVDGQVTFN